MKRAVVAVVAACVLLLGWWIAQQGRQTPSTDSPGVLSGRPSDALTPEQERELHRIADLGYVDGRVPPRERTGVTVYDPEATYDGYTLFTFAKGPEAVLVDMHGELLHSWSIPGTDYWARAHLYGNGDILVLTCDPYRLMRIDSDSRKLWEYPKPAHHDFDVLDDGTIWVLTREATTRENIRGGSWLLDDVLVHLDRDGNEIERQSLLEAFENTDGYRNWVVDSELPDDTDIFHTNSIEVDAEARRALLSIRALNVVALLDLNAGEIVWGLKGPWRRQHEAQLMDGVLLLFDNLGLREQSRVMEFDIATGAILWSYTEPSFFTKGAGAQQRLPNGNTLISESEAGRIIEVTREGDIVWEYINPRVVENGRRKTLGIMRAVRVPDGFPMDWAEHTDRNAAAGVAEEDE
jgi:hypothetical protein